MKRPRSVLRRLAVCGAVLLAGCGNESTAPALVPAPALDMRQRVAAGAEALAQNGCGSCHRIPGIAGAHGVVGPPLVDMARRVYIGRGMPNTAQNLTQWIRAPQQFAPGSAMPEMQVSADHASLMVDYLYATPR